MSSLAANDFGDVATAREFRDMFLDQKLKFSQFFCPTCEMELHARCIYTECVRAPHFYVPNNEKHEPWCEPLENGIVGPVTPVADDGSIPGFKVLRRDVELPEALVRRRMARMGFPVPTGLKRGSVSGDEAKRRAKRLRDVGIPQRQTTSMLREVATAYERLGAAVREQAEKEKTNATEMWRRVNEAHSRCPLDLYGERLDYNSAFRNPKGKIHTAPRIYKGRRGTADFHEDRVIIVAGERFGPQPIDQDDPSAQAQFVVFLPPDPGNEMAWQTNLRTELEAAAKRRAKVNWYAYGTPGVVGVHALLELESLDDLYVDFS